MTLHATTLRDHALQAEQLRLPRMAAALRRAAEADEARGFWYLATPYTKYGKGLGAAYHEAVRNLTVLLRAGVPVFSPIVHTHPVAATSELDATDLGIWLPADRPFMLAARGCIVCKLDDWNNSIGVAHEIDYFREAGKQVVYMEPGKLPVLPVLPA